MLAVAFMVQANRVHIALKWLNSAAHHQFLDLCDGLGGIQSLGAGFCAVHDGMAAVEFEGVLQGIQPVAGGFIAAINDPAVGMQQNGGAEVTLRIPPIAGAGGRAAGT